MNITSQVVSLELSKKLKELGVPQRSYFSYIEDDELWDATMQSDYETPGSPDRSTWVSAFTVSELAELLPAASSTLRWASMKLRVGYRIHVVVDENEIIFEKECPTEADARAEALIHLLENNIITL